MNLDKHLADLGIEPVMGSQFLVMREQDITALEVHLGVTLPPDYRKFLLHYGAAAFGRSVRFHSVGPLPVYLSSTREGYIHFFYGPTHEVYGSAYSLTAVNRILKDRMPESLLSIGGENSGNQICLGIRGPEAGKVYYWDHENEWDEEDYVEQGLPVPPDLKFQNVHLIAESFEDFVARLYVAEEGE